MTREEAITVLKGLSDNPLFSDQHKAAFNIAIHDIKAYHKWNLNELVLTQKDNEQEPVLDKIRAEIEQLSTTICTETRRIYIDADDFKENVLAIFDKYKADKEET